MIINRYKLFLLLVCVFFCCHKKKAVSSDSKIFSIEKFSGQQALVDYDSLPALHYAVFEGDLEEVKDLLDSGIDVMSLDSNGETALMYACEADKINYKIVSLLIDHGSDIMYEKEKDFSSAFLICILKSRDRLMGYLLNRLSVEGKKYLNRNSDYLSISITYSRLKIVEQLIPFQEDLNVSDFGGRLFLEKAIDQAVLLDGLRLSDRDWEGKEKNPFNDALKIIDLLIRNGADINEPSRFSSNVKDALYSPTVLSFLIEKGLDLNKPVEKYVGTNELRRFKILDLFVDKISTGTIINLQGQDVDITKESKYNSYLDVLELMIDKGAKSSQEGISPYQQLAISGVNKNNIKLMKVLLSKKKIDINFIDKKGRTLLMRAKEMKFQEMKYLLLENGAS